MRSPVYRETLSAMALTSSARTAGTANGTTVDRGAQNLSNPSVLFVVTTGTITDGSHAFAVQESDDGSAWTAAPASLVQGTAPTLTTTDGNKVFDVGYFGYKRYCRLTVTTTGGTTGGIYSAAAVLYGRRIDR